MPQLRKRKSKPIPDEVEIKSKKEKPAVSKSTVKGKEKSKTVPFCKTRICKSKRKVNINELSSDDESYETDAKKSVTEKFSLSERNDSKLGKEILCINAKDEPSDSGKLLNSSDSGISFDSSKEDLKSNNPEESRPSTSRCNENKQNEGSSSSESEWEEVEDNCETASLDDYKPDIPKEGVEITIDCPDLQLRKRKKKQFDENEWIRLYINRTRKDIQLSIHKTHLLCLLAHGFYINKVLNSDSIKALALSHIPDDIFSFTSGKKVDKVDIGSIEKIVNWFHDTFSFENEKCLFLNLFSSMTKNFETQIAKNASEYNLMFIVIARILGFKVRLCVSLYPITYKASNLIKKPNGKKKPKKSSAEEEDEPEIESKVVERQPEIKMEKESAVPKVLKEKSDKRTKKKIVEETSEKKLRTRSSVGKKYKVSSGEENDDSSDKDFDLHDDNSSDEDFQKPRKLYSKTKRNSLAKTGNKIKCEKKVRNRKILSSDSEPPSPQPSVLESENVICWSEIFSKLDKQWICIECTKTIVNKPYNIEELAQKPVSYIVSYDNDSYVKDVTRRYCNNYMTSTIKLRVDPEWWEESLEPFLPPNSQQNRSEEKTLDEMLVNKPLPSTIQGFKNHPLYALKRHLLKFEAIYPPDAPTVGFIRNEPVYARDCVHRLHSRETWLKEARVVKIGEEPYKIVKARPKWDKIAGVVKTDLPLEIFGLWQTKPYEPPTAVGGKVPRNEYGNVELFKPCMLPKGTVHLQLPGLNRVAKKLGIDCCPAVTGFDGHRGSVHPVMDGFIVCKEFKQTLIEAWDEEQENARKREEEKREKRIYGNWKKLIKGLLIRERIKLKYHTE